MGYAIEGVKGVINYLFNNLKKHRVTSSTDPRNKKLSPECEKEI